jgi:DNA-binding MarR family transcriptional regulator
MPTADETATQLSELFQRFIQLRPNLVVPEHFVRFQEQMESLRGGSPGGLDDYSFLFRIFILLAHRETPPTMGELGANLNVPLSTATRIVDWLVRANFVQRVQDSEDRRVVRVQMSESGRRLYQISVKHNQHRIADLLENFSTEEQEQLLKLTRKLLDVLLSK